MAHVSRGTRTLAKERVDRGDDVLADERRIGGERARVVRGRGGERAEQRGGCGDGGGGGGGFCECLCRSLWCVRCLCWRVRLPCGVSEVCVVVFLARSLSLVGELAQRLLPLCLDLLRRAPRHHQCAKAKRCLLLSFFGARETQKFQNWNAWNARVLYLQSYYLPGMLGMLSSSTVLSPFLIFYSSSLSSISDFGWRRLDATRRPLWSARQR